MATPPRILDPQCQAAFLARAFVLDLPGVGKGYLIPVLGAPTQDDAIGHPTIFMRLDPAGADSLLYFDPTGTGADIIPVGNEEGEVVANNSGGNYAAGDLVYLPTWDATNGMREAVLADSDTPAKRATHVCTEAIVTGATGTVSGRWTQRDVDTSAYSAADVKLYLTTTATTGNTSSETIPTAKTDLGQEVGMVGVKSATVGTIVWYPGAALVQKVGNASLQANTLSADATGRALMEADFFDAATLAAKIVLARGAVLRGNATAGAEAADISALGAILAGDGTDAAVVNLLTAALGGTSFTARAFSGAVLQEPPDNATLTAAIGSLMLLHRHGLTNLLMDETSPPTATAGRGLVVTGGVVAPQGVPDLTVQVSAAQAFSHLGRYSAPDASPTLGGFTIPAVAGEQRCDIVVIEAGGTIVRRLGTEGAAPAADPVLTAGDVPLARVTLTEGVDVDIQAGNLADLRQTAESVSAAKILSGYPAAYVAGSVAAPIPAAGTVALTPNAFNTLTPAAGGAYNLDNMTGLGEGQHAFVRIDNGANPATICDNAVGGGVIWTRRAASILLADVHDVALVVCRNARYHVFGLVIQAGQASGTTTAASTAETRVGVVRYVNPIAEEYISIVADVLAADGAQIIAGQPDHPRNLAVNITIAVNPITDGDLTVIGVGHSGQAVTRVVDLTTAVSTVKYLPDIFATVTSATITGLTGGGGAGDNIGVGVGPALGLPACSVPTASAFAVYKTVVDGANEAVAGVDAANGSVEPTTAPDAAHDYDFYFTYQVTPTQSAHSHLT